MGQTIIEKIFSKHADHAVTAGEVVFIAIDSRTARDFGGANVVKNYEREYGDVPVDDAGKTFFTFDCVVPAKTIPYANNQQTCREWAAKQGVTVYDVKEGIGSHLAIENGLAWPGSTFVGTDSHLNILGSIGAFGQGMGDVDIAFIFKTGKTWFEVPQTMRITITGDLKYPATAKDLTLAIVKHLGAGGALGKAIEFRGPAIDNLPLDGRITLSSMVTEMGGIIGFIPPSPEITAMFEKKLGRPLDFAPADTDAHYCQDITIDISGLVQQLSRPGHPDDVVEVSELAGKPIVSVFIGSCTNGRYSDIKAVYDLVKGRRIQNHVVANIVPSTRNVYRRLLKEGILEGLFDAGFNISNPGCGGCASGQIGMTGSGEVSISTSNRNFKGKQGNGEVFLASPVTAALAALHGKISAFQGESS